MTNDERIIKIISILENLRGHLKPLQTDHLHPWDDIAFIIRRMAGALDDIEQILKQ
jgi:hypothetical protein